MKHEKLPPESKKEFPFVIITIVFVLLAVGFLLSGFSTVKDKDSITLNKSFHTPETARAGILETKILVGNCFICHMGMVPDPDVIQPKFNHKSIQLNHGKNDRCYNCHLIQDRNLFTPDYGPGIVHRNVQNLCRRCHGIVYKDWLSGTHGSKRGLWQNPDEFNTTTFVCTQCHDPHTPKFQYKKYAPPPVWPEKFIRITTDTHGNKSSEKLNITGKEAS